MKSTREQIYAAVFALAAGVSGVNVSSRIFRTPQDLEDSMYPALFQEELTEEKEYTSVVGSQPRYHLHVDLTVYVQMTASDVAIGQETVIPSTALNNIIDAIEAAFAVPQGQAKNTLDS